MKKDILAFPEENLRVKMLGAAKRANEHGRKIELFCLKSTEKMRGF